VAAATALQNQPQRTDQERRDVTAPGTFSGAWHRSVAHAAGSSFLAFEGPDGAVRHWTYGEFDLVVRRTAATLRGWGVGPGDAVHLALTNSPTFVAVWLAADALGACIVPSDPMGTASELAGHLRRTTPVVGLCAVGRQHTYREAVTAAGLAMKTVAVDESDTTLSRFARMAVDAFPEVGPFDRAAVLFTSGTTGAPKGVVLTQANYAFAGSTMAAAAGLRSHHRQLVVLPLFHANAQYYSFASAISVGASVALMHTFSATGFLAQATRHGATHASLFAAPIRMILQRGAVAVPGIALEHCWYAMNIADDQYAVLSDLLGCAPRQLYGMTETIPAVLTDRAERTVPSSMGFVTDGCLVDVQAADGGSVEPGETGEIVVGGTPGTTLFLEYLDDPETTARSFRGEWFLTGDRATRCVDGRFTFAGRRADVLKVAGENVSTVEVEQVLSAHPLVLEAAVIGRPDDIRDEVPVAFVVATDPTDPPSLDELHAWCADHLTKAKRPRDIEFVDALPRTSVGKIRTFLLRDPDAESAAPSPAETAGRSSA